MNENGKEVEANYGVRIFVNLPEKESKSIFF
jgi:hypothetical protein